MKPEKAGEPSKLRAKMMYASGVVKMSVTKKFCQRMLIGIVMLNERLTSVLVSIFRGKGDVRNCNAHRRV